MANFSNKEKYLFVDSPKLFIVVVKVVSNLVALIVAVGVVPAATKVVVEAAVDVEAAVVVTVEAAVVSDAAVGVVVVTCALILLVNINKQPLCIQMVNFCI